MPCDFSPISWSLERWFKPIENGTKYPDFDNAEIAIEKTI